MMCDTPGILGMRTFRHSGSCYTAAIASACTSTLHSFYMYSPCLSSPCHITHADCRIRLLMSAEAMPFELFEDVLTQQDVHSKPELAARKDIVVDDNLGFSKVRWCGCGCCRAGVVGSESSGVETYDKKGQCGMHAKSKCYLCVPAVAPCGPASLRNPASSKVDLPLPL